MHFIVHRVNTIKDLLNIPFEYGVEVDLRDFGHKLILHHDPFKEGEDFEEYLKFYNHGILILNIKSEGIEFKVLEVLKKNNIKNYFFLDSSFPMINHLSLKGEKNIALRFSEFEGIDTISLMSKRVNWVWVDCFSKLPITFVNFKILKDLGYKLCLVSPELQDQNQKLEKYKEYLLKYNVIVDAICTKAQNIQRWKR
jgi:hypothetical protein